MSALDILGVILIFLAFAGSWATMHCYKTHMLWKDEVARAMVVWALLLIIGSIICLIY